MFQFIFRKNFKCIEDLSIDAIEQHSFDEPVDRQTMRKFGVGRTLTVELPISDKIQKIHHVKYFTFDIWKLSFPSQSKMPDIDL